MNFNKNKSFFALFLLSVSLMTLLFFFKAKTRTAASNKNAYNYNLKKITFRNTPYDLDKIEIKLNNRFLKEFYNPSPRSLGPERYSELMKHEHKLSFPAFKDPKTHIYALIYFREEPDSPKKIKPKDLI